MEIVTFPGNADGNQITFSDSFRKNKANAMFPPAKNSIINNPVLKSIILTFYEKF
jgi:hypothetical protein